MKKIKVAKENAEKIEKALAEVNGRASAHTYKIFSEIAQIAKRFEASMSKYLSKKESAGARFFCVSGDSVPNRYDHKREATGIVLECCSTGIFLVEVSRQTIYQDGGREVLLLKKDQETAAFKRIKQNWTIQEAV